MEQDSVRYDQQTSVCVLGSSAVAMEILKSLVLAGVGKFRVIDDAVIGESDLGQNFFTTADDVGKSRAEIVVKNLLELIPSVKGDFVVRNFEQFNAMHLKDLLEFSTVISANLTEKRAERLSNFLFEHGVPLVYTRICGMFGYVRLCYNQHTVWNSHLENPPNDFRLVFSHSKMIELFTTFGKSGLILRCFSKGSQYFKKAVNKLISIVLLQERNVTSFNREGATIKYKLDNETDIIVVLNDNKDYYCE
ncbi:thiF family domain-containing protein [Ditylenchus destructor]|nr:thiF family domain-containing protein [Ditylenchus destructor]